MTHAGAEKKAQSGGILRRRGSRKIFSGANIHRYYSSTNHRNPTVECIVYSRGIREQREKNDAPETDFHRCFPHEPLQEQTKEAAG
jgi:hypothetical protein